MNRLEGIKLFSKWKKVNLLGMKRICNRGSLPVQMRIRTRAYQHQSETHLGLFSKHTYLVEEEEEEIDDTLAQAAGATVPLVTPGVHGTVHEATPLEPELPWWKQRRNKAILVIFCVLITALPVLEFHFHVSLFLSLPLLTKSHFSFDESFAFSFAN